MLDLTTTDVDVLYRVVALEAHAPDGVGEMDVVHDLLAAMRTHSAFADLTDPTPELLAATEDSARRLAASGLVELDARADGRMILHSTVDGRRLATEGT